MQRVDKKARHDPTGEELYQRFLECRAKDDINSALVHLGAAAEKKYPPALYESSTWHGWITDLDRAKYFEEARSLGYSMAVFKNAFDMLRSNRFIVTPEYMEDIADLLKKCSERGDKVGLAIWQLNTRVNEARSREILSESTLIHSFPDRMSFCHDSFEECVDLAERSYRCRQVMHHVISRILPLLLNKPGISKQDRIRYMSIYWKYCKSLVFSKKSGNRDGWREHNKRQSSLSHVQKLQQSRSCTGGCVLSDCMS